MTLTGTAAGMYAYLLGGSDCTGADRDRAESALTVAPQLRDMARVNRSFVLAAVHRLAGLHRIGQFLDLGCGLPAGPAVHGEARLAEPGAVVAYADIDATVVSHAAAVYRPRTVHDPDGDEDLAVIQADLTDPPSVLDDKRVLDLIDFTEPAAVIFGASLYCPPGQGREVVAAYLAELAPCSAVVVSAACFADPAVAGALEACAAEAGSGWRNYTPGEVAGLLGGLRLLPGRTGNVACWPMLSGDRDAMMAGGVGIV